jgi:hypothetical protein
VNKVPKIYVVNRGGHDLSPALKYGGPIIYMTEGQQNRFAVAAMYRKFADVLEESSSDDYLLPTGLANMNLIAGSCFAYKHGRLNLLLFKDGRYVERKVLLSELLTRSDNGQA